LRHKGNEIFVCTFVKNIAMDKIKAMLSSIPSEDIALIISGLVGSFIYVSRRKLTPMQQIISMGSGVSAAYFIAPIVCAYLDWTTVQQLTAIGFAIGLFGIEIVELIMAIFDELQSNPGFFLDIIKSKLKIKSNEGNKNETKEGQENKDESPKG